MDFSINLSDKEINSKEKRSTRKVRKTGNGEPSDHKLTEHDVNHSRNKDGESHTVDVISETSYSSEAETFSSCDNISLNSPQNTAKSKSHIRNRGRLSLKKNLKKNEGPANSQTDVTMSTPKIVHNQSKAVCKDKIKARKPLFKSSELNKASSNNERKVGNTSSNNERKVGSTSSDLSYSGENYSLKSSTVRKTSRLTLKSSPQITDLERMETYNEPNRKRSASYANLSSTAVEKLPNNNFNVKPSSASTSQENELCISDSSTILISNSESDDDNSRHDSTVALTQSFPVSGHKQSKILEKEAAKQSRFQESLDSSDSDSDGSNTNMKFFQNVEKNTRIFSESDKKLDSSLENVNQKHNGTNPSNSSAKLGSQGAAESVSENVIDSQRDKSLDISKLSRHIFKNLKNNKPQLVKLMNASLKLNSMQQKQTQDDIITISSDEEPGSLMDEQEGCMFFKKESDRNITTGSLSRSSSSETKQKFGIKSLDSPRSSASSELEVTKMFPALTDISDSSSMSLEIPYQGDNVNLTVGKILEKPAIVVHRLVTTTTSTSTSSIPSLQRKPSSFYENDLCDLNSPPLLSQYFTMSSPTPSQESITTELSLSDNSKLNLNDSSPSASAIKKFNLSIKEHSSPTETMFTENSNPFNEDNVHGKVTDILDMLNHGDVDEIPDQNLCKQAHDATGSNSDKNAADQPAQYCGFDAPVSSHLSISVSCPVINISNFGDTAVVKTEVDADIPDDRVNNCMYSEIDDTVHVYDSDDEEFFLSQSVTHPNYLDEEECEEGINSVEKRNLQRDESNDQVMLEDNFDDRSVLKKLKKHEEAVIAGTSGSRNASSPTVAESDSDENWNAYDDLDTEEFPIVSDNRDNNYNDIPDSKKSTEPSELDEVEFSFGNDNDEYFLSQVDDNYNAQVDNVIQSYTTEKDDDDGVVNEENVIDVVKNNHGERTMPITLSRNKETKKTVYECNNEDTQDLFLVTTQVSNTQAQYDAETLPVSFSSDEDTQGSHENQHRTSEVKAQENDAYGKETLDAISNDDHNLFNMATQHFPLEAENEDCNERYMDIATTFQNKENNPYVIVTQSLSSDEDSEYLSSLASLKTKSKGLNKDSSDKVTYSVSSDEDSEGFFSLAKAESKGQNKGKAHVFSSIKNKSKQKNSQIEDSFEKETHTVYSNVEMTLNNQDLYDRETLSPSSDADSECFLSVATQKTLKSENEVKGFSGTQTHPISILQNEDTLEAVDIEEQENYQFQDSSDRSREIASSDVHMDSLYNMATQKCFQPDTKDQDQYNRETLSVSPSSSPDSENFFTVATQNYQSASKNQLTCNGKNYIGSDTINENIQLQGNKKTNSDSQLSSKEKDPHENTSHTTCQNKLESLYNIETQESFSPAKIDENQNSYLRETLASSPSPLEVSVCLTKKDTEKGSETNYCAADDENPDALLIMEDTQDPFSIETQVATLDMQDQSCTSDDSDHSIFSQETQKDFSPPISGQDAYDIQTQAMLGSLDEDTQDPFSVGTQINSSLDANVNCSFDGETVAVSSSQNENSQDPFNVETICSDQLDEQASSSSETSLVSSPVNKVTNNHCFIHTLKGIPPPSDLISLDKETTALGSNNDDQIHFQSVQKEQDPFVTETQIDVPLPREDKSCSVQIRSSLDEDYCQIFKNVKSNAESHFPIRVTQAQSVINSQKESTPVLKEQDPFVTTTQSDAPLPSENKSAIVDMKGHLNQMDHEASTSCKERLTANLLRNIKKMDVSAMIKKLPLQIFSQSSHKVNTISEKHSNEISSGTQTLQSPYFRSSKKDLSSEKLEQGSLAQAPDASCLPSKGTKLSSSTQAYNGLTSLEAVSTFTNFNDMAKPKKSSRKNLFCNKINKNLLNVQEINRIKTGIHSSISQNNNHVQKNQTSKHLGEETINPQKNLQISKESPENSQCSSVSSKRPAIQNNELSAKRKCGVKTSDSKTTNSSKRNEKRPNESTEHNESLPILKIKKLRIENPSECSWLAVNKRKTNNNRQNRFSSPVKHVSRSKNSRSKTSKTTKTPLTSLIEKAKHKQQERLIKASTARLSPDQIGQISSTNVNDNDDVEMPSTQDMMNLGLPILSAKLPVSKKHLALGLPSQGRVASEEGDQPSRSKTTNENIPVSVAKTSSRKDTLPPVPLFSAQALDKYVSLKDADNITANDKYIPRKVADCLTVTEKCAPSHVADSAVVFNSLASSRKSSTECKEPLRGLPLAKISCHQVSRGEPSKLVAESPSSKLSVSFSNSLPPPSTADSVSAALPTSFVSVVTRSTAPVHKPENTSILLTSSLTLSTSTKEPSNYKEILRNNTNSSKFDSDANRALPKMNLCSSHEVTLQQTAPSQLKITAKQKSEAKLRFLSIVLKWNPKWLEEREKNQDLPTLFGGEVKVKDACCRLQIFYTNFESYVDITSRLLVLECWETVFRDWKSCKSQQPVQLQVHCLGNKAYSNELNEGRSLLSVELIGLCTQQDRQNVPTVGDLLTFDYWGTNKQQQNKIELCQNFALVKNVSIRNIEKKQFLHTHPLFANNPALRDRNPLSVSIRLLIRFRGIIINTTKFHTIKKISSLKIIERQMEALVNLPDNPLSAQLLNPSPGPVFSHKYVEPSTSLQKSKLNKEQACAVETISQEVVGNPASQRVFLLQGPPGTGKSHTVLALIDQILRRTHYKARICLATPSNAAVDEIAKRIIQHSMKQKQLGSGYQPISLVRVGNLQRVNQCVKPYMWEELVKQKLLKDVPESLKVELNSLKKQEQELENSLRDSSLAQEQKVMKSRKLKELHSKITKLQADIEPSRVNTRARYNAKCHVLDEAHIICGTLNSFGAEDLKDVLLRSEEHRHKKVPFTCLIIDEATQAIEVDCLIPLQYRMTKVVLVGDHEQLPATVLSQMASDKLLGRSLFERMDLCIKEFPEGNRSPIMMLTRQYRMHKEILSLPNSFFYEDQLETDESVLGRREVIAPYLVFDIQDSRESRDESKKSVSNEDEAECTAQLCEVVYKKIKQIGVICPYADQQQAILRRLRQKNLAIEVNTVDSFQGQERDVIIMSCVRAQSNPSSIGFVADRKRMNVALTRAKQALYVIGHFDTLRTDDLWAELYRNAKKRKLLIEVRKTADFLKFAENAVIKIRNAQTV